MTVVVLAVVLLAGTSCNVNGTEENELYAGKRIWLNAVSTIATDSNKKYSGTFDGSPMALKCGFILFAIRF